MARRLETAGEAILIDEHAIPDIELIRQCPALHHLPQKHDGPEREIDLATVRVLRHPTRARWITPQRLRVAPRREYLAEIGQPMTAIGQRSNLRQGEDHIDIGKLVSGRSCYSTRARENGCAHEIVRVAPIDDTSFYRFGRRTSRLIGHME